MAIGNTRPVPDHLTTDPGARSAGSFPLDAEKGLFCCEECGRRVTRNKSGREYGHRESCRHHMFFTAVDE